MDSVVPNKVLHLVASMEEAIELVKEFWQAMPHGRDLTFPKEAEGWQEELTMGDRTKIRKGVLPKEKGKWVVMFQGNNQPLTKEAVAWLKEKGIIK